MCMVVFPVWEFPCGHKMIAYDNFLFTMEAECRRYARILHPGHGHAQ